MRKLNKYYRFQITAQDDDLTKLGFKIHHSVGIKKVKEHIKYIKRLNGETDAKIELIHNPKFEKGKVNVFYKHNKLKLQHTWGYVLAETKMKASEAVENYLIKVVKENKL